MQIAMCIQDLDRLHLERHGAVFREHGGQRVKDDLRLGQVCGSDFDEDVLGMLGHLCPGQQHRVMLQRQRKDTQQLEASCSMLWYRLCASWLAKSTSLACLPQSIEGHVHGSGACSQVLYRRMPAPFLCMFHITITALHTQAGCTAETDPLMMGGSDSTVRFASSTTG